jgi:outer membrane protein TolC
MKHPILLGGAWLWLSACGGAALAAEAPPIPPTAPSVADAPASTELSALLAQPLDQPTAVRLALAHSPALRALQARSEAQSAQALAASRPGLLGFSLSRLKQGDETEIERHLSIGLLDLLLWPWRSDAADRQIALQQQTRALAVLNHAQAVRTQWVMAVAAQARLRYQADSLSAAETTAELARRLQATGQFSAAQQQTRAAQASEARLAQTVAAQQARREREALVRLLGLQGDQARQLTLPDQLPALPTASPWTEASVQQAAQRGRLDVRLAESRWRASRGESRSAIARSLVDVEAGYTRKSSSDAPVQQGPDVSFRLISVDLGAARRDAVRQEEQAALAAWQQTAIDAESQLRERWADHLAAQASAREATEVLRTLRRQLLDERLKQYNGMLIGPLELLDEARAHSGSVLTALDALRDFWLADAALQAATEGSTAAPAALSAPGASGESSAAAAAH